MQSYSPCCQEKEKVIDIYIERKQSNVRTKSKKKERKIKKVKENRKDRKERRK